MIFTLKNIVDLETLQEIQDRFADATGLGVVISDENGTPVTKPSNFTNFCSYIRSSSSEGLRGCMLSDERLGRIAANRGKPTIHRCHSGLVDLAAPIILNEKYMGAILCGQVLIQGQDKERLDQIRRNTKHLQVDHNLLDQYFEQIEFTNQKRVEAAADMLFLVANYIVKMAATYLTQEELNEKNQKLMEELQLRAQLEKTLQETQLKVLQAQINPHFLFNTLNTISRLAYLENAAQTQDVTYALAKILRYSLRNIDQLVSLSEELEFVRNYLNIQQSRFRNKIQYEQNFTFDVGSIKIPILCVQPIIENALLHGFESQDKMVIRLCCFSMNDNVVLEISDNGAGIPEEKLSSILSDKKIQSNGHTTGIGLKNVHKRIQYYFGEGYGITAIDSRPGAGAKVQITIPKVGGDLV
ncbi:PocR ligand-binding domain-containing protein [Aneurinibacillus sp. Ricciae_BoGa-3]|uniref:sensor histidine kinase n=1 Tax=Aneurinibacillus sp. Ricciae_BoGa-3 TaxID=3022697 RepID=UPI002341B64B|nr:PocR ligand-binding domain-containing protein [Aneurinibacillus sp. Ricciae_BoGa-3]WCK52628.1 PocR ligand-binding domain-containing protein [Aneurinibacillus sp. Ricciae_BoGa-3]